MLRAVELTGDELPRFIAHPCNAHNARKSDFLVLARGSLTSFRGYVLRGRHEAMAVGRLRP